FRPQVRAVGGVGICHLQIPDTPATPRPSPVTPAPAYPPDPGNGSWCQAPAGTMPASAGRRLVRPADELAASLPAARDPPRGAAAGPACDSACSEHRSSSLSAGVDQGVRLGVLARHRPDLDEVDRAHEAVRD